MVSCQQRAGTLTALFGLPQRGRGYVFSMRESGSGTCCRLFCSGTLQPDSTCIPGSDGNPHWGNKSQTPARSTCTAQEEPGQPPIIAPPHRDDVGHPHWDSKSQTPARSTRTDEVGHTAALLTEHTAIDYWLPSRKGRRGGSPRQSAPASPGRPHLAGASQDAESRLLSGHE